MKPTRAANYLLMFDLFLSGATRAASLMHQCPDSREAFGHLRAMRAANAKACLREWRHMRALMAA
jgi:hypothetical protein